MSVDLARLRRAVGPGAHIVDPRIDLPLEEQVELVMQLVTAQRPDYRRGIPVSATDHDILIHAALGKLIAALEAQAVPAVSVDLATLQERYPVGSRWRKAGTHRSCVVMHVGQYRVMLRQEQSGHEFLRTPEALDTVYERIPDPPPSPITEPMTLHSFARHGNGPGYGMGGPFDEDGGNPMLHLLPPGQDPPADAVHRGWWWS